MDTIAFTILGHVQARMHGQLREDWASPQVQKIIAALLVYPNKSISRKALALWVWPEDRQPENLDATFHTNAARIRAALDRLDVRPRLVLKRRELCLEIEENLVDFHAFRALVRKARDARRENDHALASELAGQAIELWDSNEPLADLETEHAERWRRHVIEHEWLPANDLLIDELFRTREYEAALARLDSLRLEHGDLPMLSVRRLQALHHLDRGHEADAFYLTARRTLLDDGDDDAADHLRQIHNGLRHDPAPLPTSVPDPGPTEPAAPPRLPVRHHLPPDIPDFVGRQVVLDKLSDLATGPDGGLRPVTFVLSGLGGVGKTALVCRWTHSKLGKLLDLALYIDMRGDPGATPVEYDEAVDTLLRALAFPVDRLPTAAARAAKLAELAAGRRAAVVLDNASSSAQVERLLALFPSSVVMVTCRLGMSGLTGRHGVHMFTIPSLHTYDATGMLMRRIGSRAEGRRETVQRLAQLCGGLPLMIQLVARYIDINQSAPLVEFVTELQDHTRLLEIGGTESGAAANVGVLLTLTYEALPADSQRLFRLLALHPAREIGLHAAAALAGCPLRETRRMLDVLVDANFLQNTGSLNRFRFHDLLRGFGIEQAKTLGETERAAAERRLLSFCLHTSFHIDRMIFPFRIPVPMLPLEPDVSPMSFVDESEASAWLLVEDWLTIVDWSAARGHHSYAWRIPHNIYGLYKRSGRFERLRLAFETAVTSTQIEGDLEPEGATRNDLGLIYMDLGEYLDASKQLNLASAIARQAGSSMGIAISLSNLARLESLHGDSSRGIDLMNQALELARNVGSVELESTMLHRLGDAYQRLNQRVLAVTSYRQSLWLRQRLKDEHGQAATLAEIGSVLSEQGDYSVAESTCYEALSIISRIHDVEAGPRVLATLATIQLRQKRFTAAVDYARPAVRLARHIRSSTVEADALHTLGHALYQDGRLEAALEGWKQALEIYVDLRDVARVQHVTTDLAHLPTSSPLLPAGRSDAPSSIAKNFPDAVPGGLD